MNLATRASEKKLTFLDTPSDFTQLTTYRDAPTTSVWIDKEATPGPSTYASAASFTASTSKSTSSNPSLASSTSSHSNGLSTGAKAGIGAGVAGGVLFLAAVGIAVWLLRKRGTKKADNRKQGSPPQYPQSQDMQHMAAYPTAQGMPWTPYPQTGIHDQYYDSAYRSHDQSPGEHGQERMGSMMKDNTAASHRRVPSAPEEVLRPMELEGEIPSTVHEIGEGNGGVAK